MEGELDGLDVIIVDDDETACGVIGKMVSNFYSYGNIYKFLDAEEAKRFSLDRKYGIAIFIVDVFLSGRTGFAFLDSISEKYRSVYEDTIIITGDASDEVVNLCLDADVNYLLQKPIRLYALQLAVKSIATKYLRFAETIQKDPEFARWVNSISKRYFAQMPRLPKG